MKDGYVHGMCLFMTKKKKKKQKEERVWYLEADQGIVSELMSELLETYRSRESDVWFIPCAVWLPLARGPHSLSVSRAKRIMC